MIRCGQRRRRNRRSTSRAIWERAARADIRPGMADSPRFITPAGYAAIRAEYDTLCGVERPKIVEVVSWAAALGDRSENADYLYGKKRLREIDRRVRFLIKRLEAAEVVKSAGRESDQVFFGASVKTRSNKGEQTVTIVGVDEVDLSKGNVSWISPIAKAL